MWYLEKSLVLFCVGVFLVVSVYYGCGDCDGWSLEKKLKIVEFGVVYEEFQGGVFGVDDQVVQWKKNYIEYGVCCNEIIDLDGCVE